MSELCAFTWCAAFAVDGCHCPVHAKHPKLRPDYLAGDEEPVKSMMNCDACKGTGDHEQYCGACGRTHWHTCGKCSGEGRVTHRKKVSAA